VNSWYIGYKFVLILVAVNKKFELMLTRHAKAYSSSNSVV